MLALPTQITANRAKANALAHNGMKLHGYAADDFQAWRIFYDACYAYVQRTTHLPKTNRDEKTVVQVFELAAAKVENYKKLLW